MIDKEDFEIILTYDRLSIIFYDKRRVTIEMSLLRNLYRPNGFLFFFYYENDSGLHLKITGRQDKKKEAEEEKYHSCESFCTLEKKNIYIYIQTFVFS